MPLFMDRHDVSPDVTAENVAHLHQEDLKIQHAFNCRGLTYWFDAKRNTAFCLIEAPNIKAIQEMHAKAHGQVPNQIIEVESAIVESFLGRIEDPASISQNGLNIIDEPAHRTIMKIRILSNNDNFVNRDIHSVMLTNIEKSIETILKNSKASIVKHAGNCFLVSFRSVTQAISSSLKVHSLFHQLNEKKNKNKLLLQIGISAGSPVSGQSAMFGEAMKLVDILCALSENKIMISSEVKALSHAENSTEIKYHQKYIFNFTSADEKILMDLFDYTEASYSNAFMKVQDFARSLGLSRSRLYRKIIFLTGKPLNTFVKEYRLDKAMELLLKNQYTVSEIAYDTGFTSPSYFSKCFQKKFGVSPSELKTSVTLSA